MCTGDIEKVQRWLLAAGPNGAEDAIPPAIYSFSDRANALCAPLLRYVDVHRGNVASHVALAKELLHMPAGLSAATLARRLQERLELVPPPMLTRACGADDYLVRGEMREKLCEWLQGCGACAKQPWRPSRCVVHKEEVELAAQRPCSLTRL